MNKTTTHRFTKGPHLLIFAALLAGLAVDLGPTPEARATDYDVPCDVNQLITTITTANGNGVADTITLALGCTYTLTTTNNGNNGLPSITTTITINGNGATIQRDLSFTCPDGTNPEFRIFHVAGSGDLTLKDLTVSNGCCT